MAVAGLRRRRRWRRADAGYQTREGKGANSKMNRREFIGRAAAAGGALFFAEKGESRPKAPSAQIHLGIIGPGSPGQPLMRPFLRGSRGRFSRLCDVYEPSFPAARVT